MRFTTVAALISGGAASAILTAFETSFATEIVTTATATVTQVNPPNPPAKRKKERSDACKRRSSGTSASQTSLSSVNSISATSATPSPAGPVCTVTVTAAALNTTLNTTTTVTVTGSAIATAVETVTSLVIARDTVTISTTDVVTTVVPTTMAVTATTVVTDLPPPATPTFILKAVSGSVTGQYLKFSGGATINFSPLAFQAASFLLKDNGSLLPIVHAQFLPDNVAYYYPTPQDFNYFTYGDPNYLAVFGRVPASCQLAGPTTIGSTGSFTCPKGGNAASQLGYRNGCLSLQTSTGPDDFISVEYKVLS
ncbi:hypothetical protein PG994_009501 [Apiospora phragmitis]|uniref:Uncharacterized protein n=1 Tax=Apiospora phragmitis TaxID=2905665 RepID=A0ABR1U6D2_9PEZI